MSKLFLRHNLALLLFFGIALPGILAILVCIFGQHAIFRWMTPNYKLGGYTNDTHSPAFDLTHLKTHQFQKNLEARIAANLPMRSFLIRLNNQIYYSIFQKSHSENVHIIIGKDKQLHQDMYINSYCGMRELNHSQLVVWADKIKQLHDFFEQQGKTFIYVITPSKAEYIPETIPKRFHCNITGVSPHIKEMESLLKERHILYVNGPELMIKATQQYHLPMFPQGGIHWNDLAVTIGSNAVIQTINSDGHVHLKPLDFSYILKNNPKGVDRDLINLINVMHPDDHYTVPKVTFKSMSSARPTLSLALIGGSFLWQMTDVFMRSKTFSNISYYRYFHQDRTDYHLGKDPITHTVNPSSIEDLAAALKADVIILEENSALTVSNHGQEFYDAMQKLVWTRKAQLVSRVVGSKKAKS